MFGFIRVGAVSPKLKVACCSYNTGEIITLAKDAAERNINVLLYPELCITGYTCGDLFRQTRLLDSAENSLSEILEKTSDLDMFIALGMPVRVKNRLYNCGIAIYKGDIIGIVPKKFLANNNEFYEKRWFSPSGSLDVDNIMLCGKSVPIGTDLLFNLGNGAVVGIEICRDLWMPIPPSSYQAMSGATVLLNLSASNDTVTKKKFRDSLISSHSERLIACYAYCSSGIYESTTDMVYGGHNAIYENGLKLAESKSYCSDSQLIFADTDTEMLVNARRNATDYSSDTKKFRSIDMPVKCGSIETLIRPMEKTPFVPENISEKNNVCEEAFNIQTIGLAGRLRHIGAKTCVVAVSGGLDSTLALLCAVNAFDFLGLDRKGIVGVTMPGFGTTGRTFNNAINLMKGLGISYREISIKNSCIQHFKDIGFDDTQRSVVYENAQARERTQIAMDIANMENGLMVGSGDLSELALGFATYGGDHMSMYGVNAGIPKTLVKALVEWASYLQKFKDLSKFLIDIVETPISPELLPEQITEDITGPYLLHDFFIYNFLKHGFSPEKLVFIAKNAFKDVFDEEEITKWLKIFYKRFFTSQYKRSCMPDGPKVCGLSLSPRGDWKMPSDASYTDWII